MSDDDDQSGAYYERNKAYSLPSDSYLTTLSSSDEAKFKTWVAQNDVPFDPSPKADYDMRGFWQGIQSGDSNAKSAVDPNDGKLHYSDYWKTPYHQTFSSESKWAMAGAPHWNDKDQLVMPDGTVVFDDKNPGSSTDLSGALSQISGSGSSALQNFQDDSAKLDSSTKDLDSLPAFDAQKEMQQGPQVNRDGVMATMAPALLLASLGGAVAGVHPTVMLGALDGITKGLIQGNDKAVKENQAKWDDAYQRYMDRYKQQFAIYKQMQSVYKGDVNADLKALEIALKATGYQGKIDEQTLRQWQWTQVHTPQLEAAKLREVQAKAAKEEAEAKQTKDSGGPLDEDTLAMAATVVAADPNKITGFVAGYGKAGAAAKRQIQQRIAQDLKARGDKPEDLVSDRATSKAETLSINKLVPQRDAVASFESLAKFNGDRVLALVDKLDDSNIPLLAVGERLAKKAGGSADAAEFQSSLTSFQTEAAKILNNPAMTGSALTDSMRNDLKAVVSGNMNASQLKRVINRIYSEMDTRRDSLNAQITNASSRLNPGGKKTDYVRTRVDDDIEYGLMADGKTWVVIGKWK